MSIISSPVLRTLFCLGLFLSLHTACVSKKKYKDLDQTKNGLDRSLLETRRQLSNLQMRNAELGLGLGSTEGALQECLSQKNTLERQVQSLYGELQNCLAQVQALRSTKSELEQNLAERQARIIELEKALAERESKLNALLKSLLDALTGFSASDLTVEERGGRIYVSLSQKLLFKTGSAVVSAEGRQALAKLAAVLAQQSDLSILVEGHTDSDGEERVNWRLSSERALAVTYILTENKVPQERITAAGRGEFAPIAPNTTEEGKARNRRTDIVISPNWEAVWSILKNR